MNEEDTGMALATLVTALAGALEKQGVDAKRLLKDVTWELNDLAAPLAGTGAGKAIDVALSALVWSHPEGPMGGPQN